MTSFARIQGLACVYDSRNNAKRRVYERGCFSRWLAEGSHELLVLVEHDVDSKGIGYTVRLWETGDGLMFEADILHWRGNRWPVLDILCGGLSEVSLGMKAVGWEPRGQYIYISRAEPYELSLCRPGEAASPETWIEIGDGGPVRTRATQETTRQELWTPNPRTGKRDLYRAGPRGFQRVASYGKAVLSKLERRAS